MKPAIEKGEKCYNARLTAAQVHEARILVMKGPIGTLPQIARRWGVEKQTLRNAVAGKNWKWLPLPTPEEIENTPLPNWIEAVGAPHRSHCGTCVHWCSVRSCTMQIPEAGGFFATSCAAFARESILSSSRKVASVTSISPAGLNLIKDFEGLRLEHIQMR
jgi:hypothetical protein